MGFIVLVKYVGCDIGILVFGFFVGCFMNISGFISLRDEVINFGDFFSSCFIGCVNFDIVIGVN